ncbi:MAG: hypothetical protein IKA47_07785 [Oscillospiraceae bacterium]|nr:hypothetical protein [Oscillospiraceae bacterium]
MENVQTETKVKKSNKKLMVILIIAAVVALIATAVLLALFNPTVKTFLVMQKLKKAEIGDTFMLGTYEQDGRKDNGAEEIEWIVLAKEGDKVLALSKYALDAVAYNSLFESSSWETCTLRTWLNEEFYPAAFHNAEKNYIAITTVAADKNPAFATDPGSDTQDPMFLLSVNEAEKYGTDRAVLRCEPTKYAEYSRIQVDERNGYCKWWLRSPGLNPSDATAVGSWGFIYGQGNYVFFQFYGVRPAMWIDLS